MCSSDVDDGESCVGDHCVHGPRRCADPAAALRDPRVRSRAISTDDAPTTSLDLLEAAVTTAEALCGGVETLDAMDTLTTAAEFNGLLKQMIAGDVAGYAVYGEFLDDAESLAREAAAVLGDASCAPSPCNAGLALFATLEAFLVLVDGHGERAWPGDAERQHVFADHKIFFADGKFLSDYTVERVDKRVCRAG